MTAKILPTRGDYLIVDGNLYIITCIDLDSEVWIEGMALDMTEMTTGDYILQDIEAWDTHYFDDTYIGYFDINTKYTYIPDYKVNYVKLKLTRLAKKMYGIPDSFKGSLYFAERK